MQYIFFMPYKWSGRCVGDMPSDEWDLNFKGNQIGMDSCRLGFSRTLFHSVALHKTVSIYCELVRSPAMDEMGKAGTKWEQKYTQWHQLLTSNNETRASANWLLNQSCHTHTHVQFRVSFVLQVAMVLALLPQCVVPASCLCPVLLKSGVYTSRCVPSSISPWCVESP